MKTLRLPIILFVAVFVLWLWATKAHAHHGWQTWCKRHPADPVCREPWIA